MDLELGFSRGGFFLDGVGLGEGMVATDLLLPFLDSQGFGLALEQLWPASLALFAVAAFQ